MPLSSDSWFFAFCCFPYTFSWVFGIIPFFSWLEKDAYMWREFTAELLKNGKRFLRHLSRSFFLQEAPFKRLSGRTRKRMYHIWYICCGIWIFFGLGKIPSLCAQDGTYPHQWMSFFFWREERNSFPSESCQIASWTHVAKESSWAISINRKYILTLDPNFFCSSLQCVDERCCSSWLLLCRWVLTSCVPVWNSVV